MSQAISLLTVQDTIAAADALYQRADREPLDPRRAITGASSSAILSMAVLVRQLDRIAKCAAIYTARHPDLDAWTALQELLVEAGYLPLPTPHQKEPAHGEG